MSDEMFFTARIVEECIRTQAREVGNWHMASEGKDLAHRAFLTGWLNGRLALS